MTWREQGVGRLQDMEERLRQVHAADRRCAMKRCTSPSSRWTARRPGLTTWSVPC